MGRESEDMSAALQHAPGLNGIAPTPPVLQIAGLSKTFGATRALIDASLDIKPGEIHALVGQNGSGKSTLIKALAGYHAPDPGSAAEIDGWMVNPDSFARARLRSVLGNWST